ncbi:Uncharacterised protein [Mycobacteroides abscessus subsp. abscessus]|nr:Uncharacterised protein [Mycobacteroides abscessus subsp. abscessus]
MTAPMPTSKQISDHRRRHGDHKFKARRLDGRIQCQMCIEQAAERIAKRRENRLSTPGPRTRDMGHRVEGTPAGFVTHEKGTIRTQALAPGVGITLGQLAHFVSMARDMAGMPDSARIDVVPEAKRRNRPGQRIRAMVIAPAPRAEEVEDAA